MQKKTLCKKILKARKGQFHTATFFLTVFFCALYMHDRLNRGTSYSLWYMYVTNFPRLTEILDNKISNFAWRVKQSREIIKEWKPGFFHSVCWSRGFVQRVVPGIFLQEIENNFCLFSRLKNLKILKLFINHPLQNRKESASVEQLQHFGTLGLAITGEGIFKSLTTCIFLVVIIKSLRCNKF